MPYHHRKSWRLRGWDYAGGGCYFVTCVTWRRRRLLASVRGGRMCLTRAGQLTADAWEAIADHLPGVTLDAFVIMPDHVHGIVALDPLTWTQSHPALGRPYRSLSSVIGSWKAASSRAIRRDAPDAPSRIWQRSYYDSRIRSDHSLARVRRYIERNPAQWISMLGG